jgi:hypothetical protein
MATDIWKVSIKGNSMDGLFPDGQTLQVRVWTEFSADTDLLVGRIVILKKRITAIRPTTYHAEKHTLIIHRIVGKFRFKDHLSFWEKGDNDYYPKVCYPEEIAAIVTDIEAQPETSDKLQPDLWQKRNLKLLKFYRAVGRIYAFIEEGRGDCRQEILYKVWRKGFWITFYLVCSLFNLKGHS